MKTNHSELILKITSSEETKGKQETNEELPKSTIPTKGERVVPFPSGPARRACFVVPVTLSTESSVFLSCRCETAKLPVFVHRLADPVDPWIISNCIMGSIN